MWAENRRLDTKSSRSKSFWRDLKHFLGYDLKHWSYSKISITLRIIYAWTRKTYGVIIIRPLSQVRETMYTLTEH